MRGFHLFLLPFYVATCDPSRLSEGCFEAQPRGYVSAARSRDFPTCSETGLSKNFATFLKDGQIAMCAVFVLFFLRSHARRHPLEGATCSYTKICVGMAESEVGLRATKLLNLNRGITSSRNTPSDILICRLRESTAGEEWGD